MNIELITRQAESTPKPNPLLFVHGAWHAAWCWDEYFMPYLAQQGYDCYALSLRGHGKSENNKSLRWTSTQDYVNDVTQIAEGLPSQPIIIGHSMGGYIVQKYLETHNAPAGILLASVPPIGTVPSILRLIAKHPLVMIKTTLTMTLYHIVSSPQDSKDLFFSDSMPDEPALRYHSRLQDEAFRANVLEATFLTRPQPQRVKTPVLVLGAENDRVFPQHEVHATARAYGTQATIIPNIAHDMMLEANWQIVADSIIRQLGQRGL